MIMTHACDNKRRRNFRRRAKREAVLLASVLFISGVLFAGGRGGQAKSALFASSVATLTVGVTSPGDGQSFTAPTDITITAEAGGGTISTVEFFQNGTSLGTDTSEPYEWPWNGVGAGTYTLTAVATDDVGVTATSAPVTITVTAPNAPPTVRLLTPLDGAIFPVGKILLRADAGDGDGEVTRVEFYNGATLVGTDTESPYECAWADMAPAINYTLSAKAYDDGGATTTSATAVITVTPPPDATRIKDTNYPTPDDPAKLRFVSPDGDDTAGDGSKEKPWRTVTKAVNSSTVPAGSTVVIRGGVYSEPTITIRKQLTIQPYPHEQVWFKGSREVTGWRPDGEAWSVGGWTAQFPPPSNEGSDFIDPRYPLANHRDMVFLDGRPLKQVGRVIPPSRNLTCDGVAVVPGSFCVDYAADKLYVGDDPTGRVVESTYVGSAFSFFYNTSYDNSGTIIRGLGFMHYAEAGLRIGTARVTVEANTFVWNGVQGYRFFGSNGTVSNVSVDPVVRGNTSSYNGRQGVGGTGVHRMLLEGNTISYNNLERYALTWDAAGIKVTRSDRVVWRDNVVEDNNSTGMWLDVSVTNATVVHNTARRNRSIGIFFEISRGAIIASNVAVGNGTGINISGSSAAKVYNNTLVNNGQAVEVKDTSRVNTDPAEIAAGVDWETREVVIKNNIFSNATRTTDPFAMVNIYDSPCGGVGLPCNAHEPDYATLDHNAYYRTDGAQPLYLVRWKPNAGPGAPDRSYAALADTSAGAGFRATGNEANGQELSGGTDPFFVDEAAGDYRLRRYPGNPAIGTGEPLPEDVAGAVGVIAGAPTDLGAVMKESRNNSEVTGKR